MTTTELLHFKTRTELKEIGSVRIIEWEEE